MCFTYVFGYVSCVQYPQRTKGVLNLPKLELQTVLSCCAGVGTEHNSPERASCAPNCWTIAVLSLHV